MAHDKGDHRNAAEKFALLDVYDELTREEKTKFAASLEYLDSWDNAFRIRKAINISTDDDFRDLLICAFHAGKINEATSLISENGKLIRSAKIASILQKIAEEDKEQIILMVENLDASDYSNDEDHKYFCLVSDHLQKIGENDIAKAILENCTRYSKFNLPIINRLYSIYKAKGEREKCRAILASIKNQPLGNQKEIETFIDFLIQSGEIDRANQLLLEIENSWELSPRNLKIFVYLVQHGEYSK